MTKQEIKLNIEEMEEELNNSSNLPASVIKFLTKQIEMEKSILQEMI